MTALVHQYGQFLITVVLVGEVELLNVEGIIQFLHLLNTTGIIASIVTLWMRKQIPSAVYYYTESLIVHKTAL